MPPTRCSRRSKPLEARRRWLPLWRGTVVGDERLVRDLSTGVDVRDGEVTVTVSASAPRIVPGLPTRVSHRVQGPVERFIPEGRR